MPWVLCDSYFKILGSGGQTQIYVGTPSQTGTQDGQNMRVDV
jgi:hypothetical protein